MESRTNNVIPFSTIFQAVAAGAELAREHGAVLGRQGWSAGLTDELEEAAGRLRADSTDRLAAQESAKLATVAARRAATQLRAFRRKLVAAIKLAESAGVMQTPLGPYRARMLSFRHGGLLAWAASIRRPVAEMDRALRSFFLGSPLAALDEAEKALRAAVGEHELRQRTLPTLTSRIAASRARVGNLLERLRRTAALAFADEPATLRAFRLRMRRPTKPAPALRVLPQAA